MLKEMRRRDRMLPKHEAMQILSNGEFGVLSTMGEEYPYGVPVNYVVIDDSIYIHGTSESSLKAEHIHANNRVCFTAVSNTEVLASEFSERYESAIVFGKASIADGETKEKALLAFLEKYSADSMESGKKYLAAAKDQTTVFRIQIVQITGKSRK